MAPNGRAKANGSIAKSATGVTPTSTSTSATTSAAPAWRQFNFFSQSLFKDHHDPSSGLSPETVRDPASISTLVSSPEVGLVLLADVVGGVSVLDEQWEIVMTWTAYEGGGRATNVLIAEGRWKGIVVTLGDEPSSPQPVIKVWDLGRNPSAPTSAKPILLRSARVSLPTTTGPQHPVSDIALSPSLSHLVLGFTDGSVFFFRHLDQLLLTSVSTSTTSTINSKDPAPVSLGLGKLRPLYTSHEPITGLHFRQSTLFILTTSKVLACPLAASKVPVPSVLDDLGAAVGCGGVMKVAGGKGVGGGERMCVARDEAVYTYGDEGREGCYAYEGLKASIHPLSLSSSTRSTYLAIVHPPLQASITSASATLRNVARSSSSSADSEVAKVTIFDVENKFVAWSAVFDDRLPGSASAAGGGRGRGAGVRGVWEAWGVVWVLTETGKLYRLEEQPLATSLSTLFSRNLFTLAVSLARSRDLPPSEVAEIYRRYGDHLYGKSDYEGAMGCYIKTVGTVQASYVIRKFLDAQRLTHLTSYLQELHARGLANSDHTTLLLNCYTKLSDSSALTSFLHSSASSSSAVSSSALAPLPSAQSSASDNPSASMNQEPPFDLETAIRVCRQAGYFEHAVWLAERYGAHQDYLRIQIEDIGDIKAALAYVRTLGPRGAEENLLRYGQTLLDSQPAHTTTLLVDLCCGSLDTKPAPVEPSKEVEPDEVDGGKGYLSYLAYAIPGTEAFQHSTAAGTTPIQPSSTATSTQPNLSAIPRHLRDPSAASTITTNRRSASFASLNEDAPPPYLPSPRRFFAHYVDHPVEFVTFLETIGARRFGKSLDGKPALLASPTEVPLPKPQPLRLASEDDVDEQAVWNTLLELYLSSWEESTAAEGSKARATLTAKALQLLRDRERLPYDETRALLVCTTKGFEDGFVLLYEQLGMYDDILRYWIDASLASPGSSADSSKVISALKRYGSARPYLYKLVLRYLTTSSELLSRHQGEVAEILERIEQEKVMPPVAVVEILSKGGNAGVGLVREYLKRHLGNEKAEIQSDRSLISSYRSESAKKTKEINELSDPETPRIFQVTRCSSCGGQLDLPAVHFMCRHSYHQRCLAENETQCPDCARAHGVIREIRKNNELFAGRHDLFLEEVRESEDGYSAVVAAFGKGLMSLAKGSGDGDEV